MTLPFVVLKFGGTSVSRRARWDTIGRLVQQRRTEGLRVLVVVSALSDVTNRLQASSEGAELPSDVLPALKKRHVDFANELGLDVEAVLGDRFAELDRLAADPRTANRDLGWCAEWQAQGELLSSTLGVAYLNSQGVDIGWTDAREWLRPLDAPNLSEWSRRLSVRCRLDADDDWRSRFAAQGEALLTQGFIVGDGEGGTCLLGRGGSDTSASSFGARLKADRVEIWTDVAGMFSANPRRVPEARLLVGLDYNEAQEIATTGAKVLHPRCIAPCREAGVALHIRDTDHSELPGTVIGGGQAAVPGVKAISTRRDIVLVSMESVGMWQQVGFLADVFEQFKRHGLSVDLIGSSETNVTVSLDPSENLVSSNVLEALCADLGKVCRVKVIAPCSAVTLVGHGIRSRLHRLTDVLAEFGRERVHLISQSSNDLNLTFVVDQDLAEEMLPRLHDLLIQAGAMPVRESGVFGPSWRALNLPPDAVETPWWREQQAALLARADAATPQYVYSTHCVESRCDAMQSLGAVDRRFFAIKANPHPDLLRQIYAAGLGLECVSAGELRHVFDTIENVDPSRVLFTPSFAPRIEYAEAFERGVWTTVDSATPLRSWPQLFQGRTIWLRVDPGFGRGHHEKVRTGGHDAKFGLPVSQLDDFLTAAREVNARVFGIHAHLGSGIVDPGHWREVYAQLVSIAERVGTVVAINIGGGLAVPADPAQPRFDMDALGRELAVVKAACPDYALWMEPGRYLVADAGVLLLRVTQVVDKEGLLRIGVDGGMNTLLRPALYGAWHEIVNLSRLDDTDCDNFDVVGPICETGDVLGRRRLLPRATAEGDVLLVATAGAYGAVMASNYNRRGLPAESLL
ncbi:MAG: bifunctional aspartate kinase/diaminopimelate decarboxylase [Lysobacteraceae bacterium]